MRMLAVVGLIAFSAGVALCFYRHLFTGMAFILAGAFLVDIYKDQAIAAAVSKFRKPNRSNTQK